MSGRLQPFARIPRNFRHSLPDLLDSDLRVLLWLVLCREMGETIEIGLGELGTAAGVGTRTIGRAVRRLVAAGMIDYRPGCPQGQGNGTSRASIAVVSIAPATNAGALNARASNAPNGCALQTVAMRSHKRESEKSEKYGEADASPVDAPPARTSGGSGGGSLHGSDASLDRGVSPADEDPVLASFEDWWARYGRKVNRSKALAKWYRLKPAERAQCLAVVDDFVRSTPEVRYRPHPTTYLNGRRWEDELDELRADNGAGPAIRDPSAEAVDLIRQAGGWERALELVGFGSGPGPRDEDETALLLVQGALLGELRSALGREAS